MPSSWRTAPCGRFVLVGVDVGSTQLPFAAGDATHTVISHITGVPADARQAMEFLRPARYPPRNPDLPLEDDQAELETLRDGRARIHLVLDRGRPHPPGLTYCYHTH